MITPPDFIQIPYQLLADEALQPSDRLLYGFIYWFEHLKNEKCTASNPTLADLLKVDAGSVQNSLNRLEERGYIERVYKDESRRVRLEIRGLIAFKKVSLKNGTRAKVSSNDDTVSSNNDTQLSSNDDQNKSIINKNSKEELGTPKETAQSFFSSPSFQEKVVSTLVVKGVPEQVARVELSKFVSYWTEPNGSGTKQRWQLEKVFDLRRRLTTWFSNIQKFQRSSFTKETKGITL